MRSQILGVCAVLAASLATSAFGQIQRSAISKNRVFGVQTLLPAPICDDRDLAGTIRTKLQFKPLTPPGQPVKVDLLFTSAQGDPDMQVSIDLPRPLRLASGASTARSRVTEDRVFRSSWSIQPSVYGRYPITMRLEPSQGQPAQTVRLYMDVYQEGVFLTQGAPYQTYQELTQTRPFRLLPETALGGAVKAPQHDPTLRQKAYVPGTATGTIYTWDGSGGWSTVGGTLMFLGYWTGSTWTTLWSGYTNDSGVYSATYDWSLAPGSGSSKTLWLYAMSYGVAANVTNTSNALYQYGQSQSITSSATVNMYMNDNANNELPEGAFRIVDSANRARNYSISWGNTVPQTHFWWKDSGSYFVPSSSAPDIHIGSSWDEWSKVDVVGHEYGHYHHFKICSDWLPPSPGGSHSFNTLEDPILAFVEGYATFFMNKAFNKTDYLGWINLEDNSQTNLYGQRNEASVAGAMLDISDNGAESGDFLNTLTFDWVKVVVQNRPNNMKEFYDKWSAWGWPYLTDLSNTLQTHGMNPPTFSPY